MQLYRLIPRAGAIRVQTESLAVPARRGRLTREQEAEVVRRYGTPSVLGRCQTVSEFHPEVTIKSLALDYRCSAGTILRVLKRAGRKSNAQ